MEEEKSLLRKMADMFSDALDDEEDVAHEILTLAQEAKEQASWSFLRMFFLLKKKT